MVEPIDLPPADPLTAARSIGYQNGFTDGHKAAEELYKSDAQTFYSELKALRALAAKFCEEYRKEFSSAEAIAEGWAGFRDGLRTDEAVDVAYFALRDALAECTPKGGES